MRRRIGSFARGKTRYPYLCRPSSSVQQLSRRPVKSLKLVVHPLTSRQRIDRLFHVVCCPRDSTQPGCRSNASRHTCRRCSPTDFAATRWRLPDPFCAKFATKLPILKGYSSNVASHLYAPFNVPQDCKISNGNPGSRLTCTSKCGRLVHVLLFCCCQHLDLMQQDPSGHASRVPH